MHRLLSDSCEGVEKERPKIIFLLALGADPVTIRVDKILENSSKRGGEEMELVKKAMLQLISNGRVTAHIKRSYRLEGKLSHTPTSILMTVTATSGEQVLVKENGDVMSYATITFSIRPTSVLFNSTDFCLRPCGGGGHHHWDHSVSRGPMWALCLVATLGDRAGHAMVRAIPKPAKKGSPKRAKRNRRGSSEPTSTNTTPP